MVATSNQCPATVIESKMHRNIKIIANTFDEDDYLLSSAVNFPNIRLETINYMLNCNWLTDGLHLNIGKLIQCLSALNFFSSSTNPADLRDCSTMSRLVTAATRESKLGQYLHYSKPKYLDSFIKTLPDLITLLDNLVMDYLVF